MSGDCPFGIQLLHASLCLDLECNTVFDSSMSARCPGCGGGGVYPLASWLSLDASRRERATPRRIVPQAA